METTGLTPLTGYYGVEIIQIGAVCRQTRLCAENRLNIYLRPEAYIEEEATNIHGIDMEWFDEHFYDENVYNSMSDGLEAFVEFIEEQKTYDDEEILLVAHNNFGFDIKVLVNNFDQYDVDYPNNVLAFDSLKLMKRVKDEVSNGNLRKLKLSACLDYFFDETQGHPHDAFNDANDCRRICEQGAKQLGYGSLQKFFHSNRAKPGMYKSLYWINN